MAPLIVIMKTSMGSIRIELFQNKAPITVKNFLSYVDEKFYDNTVFHRVIKNFMIQAGGFEATTPIKQKKVRTPIVNESTNGLKNERGTIAMARTPEPNSATSQFFINLADAPQRDHSGDTAEQYGYCVFGEVTDGLDIADKISQSPTANQGGDLAQTPDPAVVIKSVRVVR